MMWDLVLKAIIAAVAADATLAGIYGETIRLAGSSKLKDEALERRAEVPALEITLIGDREDELWAPMTVQWDQFVESMAQLEASELVLRSMFHTDLPITYQGIGMFAEYAGGDTLALPDRDGYFGRALRFRLTPLRRQYATQTP